MAQTETVYAQTDPPKKKGKIGFVIFILIAVLILAAAGILYYVYKTEIKTGEILNGSYSGDNCSLTLDVDAQSYTFRYNDKEESGVFDNVVLDKKKSSDEFSSVYFTADFGGNDIYEVTIELLPMQKETKLILSSSELDETYTMTKA